MQSVETGGDKSGYVQLDEQRGRCQQARQEQKFRHSRGTDKLGDTEIHKIRQSQRIVGYKSNATAVRGTDG